ncbi:MAG: 4-hydroxyproline epimerase [Gammaproteobacteria bacterium]|nr:4-hydroxyproline epimerase [Gammaproteobacteria bacterium]
MMDNTFHCIDAHTCGNPVRVVIGNKPLLVGETMTRKRQDFLDRYDWIRTVLMFEPRGHDAMSGSIIYPPVSPDNDMAILFIEVSGCLPMCGHGTIGTVTVAIEHGLVTPKTPGMLRLDTPAGLVEARYTMDGDYVDSVQLTNVPSFLHSRDMVIDLPGIGELLLDVSYGGNFYGIIEPQKNYLGLDSLTVDDIRRYSPEIRRLINETMDFIHPDNPSIRGVSHVMWTDRPKSEKADARNAVFYGERGIDRSPCGTGTSARMAQRVAKGEQQIGQKFVHESIIGSMFTGCATEFVQVGDTVGIIPTVAGWARVTGENKILIDKRDPYAKGFLLA